MKIINIVEQTTIQSAQALKSAFDEDQWNNIVSHFMRNRLANLTIASARNQVLERLHNEFGKNFYATTPRQYASIASIYNVRIPAQVNSQGNQGWQIIHDYLAPFARRSPDLPPATEQEPRLDTSPSTEESMADIASWVNDPTQNGEFRDEDNIASYVQSWIQAAYQNRSPQWREEFNGNNRQNQMFGFWEAAMNRILDTFETDGVIQKRQVDRLLYAFLQNADQLYDALSRS